MKQIKLSLLILLPFINQAQVLKPSEYLAQYKKGVQYFVNNDFERATTILNPLISRKYKNPTTPYALYYQALSYQKLKKSFESRLVIRQLLEVYPEWKNNDEAYYLLADANFSDGYYEEGLRQLNKIISTNFKQDIFNISNHHFNKLGLKELKYYNRQAPNNAGIALALVQKIYQTSTSKEDLILSDKLINSFQLGKYINLKQKSNKPVFEAPKSVSDNSINFGLMLPFGIEQHVLNSKNQYIYDFYDGMLMASDKLISERIYINLFTFDIEKNEFIINNVLKNGNLNKLDLAIGPLYQETNFIAENFFNQNKIVQVHPFSNNLSLIKNDDTFLAQASFETQSTRALEFIQTQNQIKTAAIYFGSSRKDSTFASIYKNILQNNGYNILEFSKISKYDYPKIQQKPGHIFISANDGIGNRILNSFETKKINTISIGTSASFDKNVSIVNSKNIFLINPDFTDNTNQNVIEFKKEYFAKRNSFPNSFVFQGYDLMLFFGRAFAKYGSNYKLAFETKTNIDGFTTEGYNYLSQIHDNQIVPITKYNGEIVYK